MAWFIKTETFRLPRPQLQAHLQAHHAWVTQLRQQGVVISSGYLVDQAGRRGGLPAVWLLLAGDRALIDGQAVPLIHAGLQVRVPLEWLENRHRAAHQPTDCHKTGELS